MIDARSSSKGCGLFFAQKKDESASPSSSINQVRY
jgi:hypothetical protein